MSLRLALPALRSERGSSVVELAIVCPIFLILTVALMDFSIAVWSQHTLANAAHEGVRYAIVRGASDEDIERVVKDSAVGLQTQKLDVTTAWDPDRKPGSTVRVIVRYPFDPLTPFVTRNHTTLEASAEMVVLR